MLPDSSPPPELQTTRLCPLCGQRSDISQFRRRFRDRETPRDRICNACHRICERERQRAKRAGQLDRFASAVRMILNEEKLRVLAEAMIVKLGGQERFVDQWAAHIRQAPPGTKTALQGFEAVARLMVIAAK